MIKSRPIFTLIELLVVIAIMGILLSLLMPALKEAKKAAEKIQCMANTKNLSIAWTLYADDNQVYMPRGYGHGTYGWIWGRRWGSATKQLNSIRNGTLFPYVEQTDVYRCPAADEDEFNTYSLPHSMNGYNSGGGGTILNRLNQIDRASDRMTFLCDYAFDWDACWQVYYNPPTWWNTTPIRHGAGGNIFSFADGHAFFKDWTDDRTTKLAITCALIDSPEARYGDAYQPGNEDLEWAQKAVWGGLGY